MADYATFDQADLQRAAALFCEGLTPQEIADLMSSSNHAVQQMIERAEQSGHLQYRPQLIAEGLLPEVKEFVEQELLTDALRKALKDSLELSLGSLHIVHSPLRM